MLYPAELKAHIYVIFVERVKGIEPSLPAWKAGVLPLNNTRVRLGRSCDLHMITYKNLFVKSFFAIFTKFKTFAHVRAFHNGYFVQSVVNYAVFLKNHSIPT